MRQYLNTCDMCGKQETTDMYTPEGWEQIEVKYRSYSTSQKTICKECAEKIGLPITTQTKNAEERNTIEQRLLDIIQEIAYYAQG